MSGCAACGLEFEAGEISYRLSDERAYHIRCVPKVGRSPARVRASERHFYYIDGAGRDEDISPRIEQAAREICHEVAGDPDSDARGRPRWRMFVFAAKRALKSQTATLGIDGGGKSDTLHATVIRGCICPPTSEQTCQAPLCPRKAVQT